MGYIPYGRQEITPEDLDAVTAVLRSDFLTQGEAVPAFERAIAGYTGASHAIAVNSATSALHIACLALGLGPGDWLWTSPITFVASANCALYCGARVDFVDIDDRTFNMCPIELERKLVMAERERKLPKVVVPVHMGGQSCDMGSIQELSRRFGFRIIEDASHAIGGKYRGVPIGSGHYSDITIFSFHPVKIITTGEGGIALTNQPQIARRMALLRSHGIVRDPAEMTGHPDGPWYYQQIALGFNYRLTDIQAALGLSQLNRLDNYVARRQEIASRYDAALAPLPLQLPWKHPDAHSALHLYIVRVLPTSPHGRDEVFRTLRNSGIGVNVHYIPVHLQPYYRSMGFQTGDFPKAERYYTEAISLPIFPALSTSDQELVINTLTEAVT